MQAAYDAINRRDYRTAYSLGLAQPGQSYEDFVAGYGKTDRVVVSIVAVEGDAVTVGLVAVQRDGSQQTYGGTYTVSGGIIVGAQITQAS